MTHYTPPPGPVDVGGLTVPADEQSSGGALAPRQLDVVRRFALGQSGDSIARDLRISKNTVWRHRTDAMERHGAASINDLWMRLGWLRVPE